MRERRSYVFVDVAFHLAPQSETFLVDLHRTRVISRLVLDVPDAAERVRDVQAVEAVLTLQLKNLLVVFQSAIILVPLLVDFRNIRVRHTHVGIAMIEDGQLHLKPLVVRLQRRVKVAGFVVQIAELKEARRSQNDMRKAA